MSVVAFPISRETSTVRFIADSIARLQGEDAVTFRQATAGHLFSVAIERGNDADQALATVLDYLAHFRQKPLPEPLSPPPEPRL
jgi:hypothetical protein